MEEQYLQIAKKYLSKDTRHLTPNICMTIRGSAYPYHAVFLWSGYEPGPKRRDQHQTGRSAYAHGSSVKHMIGWEPAESDACGHRVRLYRYIFVYVKLWWMKQEARLLVSE